LVDLKNLPSLHPLFSINDLANFTAMLRMGQPHFIVRLARVQALRWKSA
jgi:hypothetical protein